MHELPADVEAAIDAKVASGNYPDQITELREALASLDEFDEDVAALQLAIIHWQSGDKGLPLKEAFDQVRREIANT